MLTFNVILGYQGLLFRDFSGFCLCFFLLIRPTDPISGNAFDPKRKKKGMAKAYAAYMTHDSQGHFTLKSYLRE